MWDRVNGNLWDELTDNICGSEPVVGVPSLPRLIPTPPWPAGQAPHWDPLHQQKEQCIGGGEATPGAVD